MQESLRHRVHGNVTVSCSAVPEGLPRRSQGWWGLFAAGFINSQLEQHIIVCFHCESTCSGSCCSSSHLCLCSSVETRFHFVLLQRSNVREIPPPALHGGVCELLSRPQPGVEEHQGVRNSRGTCLCADSPSQQSRPGAALLTHLWPGVSPGKALVLLGPPRHRVSSVWWSEYQQQNTGLSALLGEVQASEMCCEKGGADCSAL